MFWKRKPREKRDPAKGQYETIIERVYAFEQVTLAVCQIEHFLGFNVRDWGGGPLADWGDAKGERPDVRRSFMMTGVLDEWGGRYERHVPFRMELMDYPIRKSGQELLDALGSPEVRKLYQQAYEASPSLMTPGLKWALGRLDAAGDLRPAIAAARHIAALRGELLGPVDKELTEQAVDAYLGGESNAPPGVVASGFSLETWDKIKLGLDRMIEGKEYKNELTGQVNVSGADLWAVRQALVQELDEANPLYKQLRAKYDGMALELELGAFHLSHWKSPGDEQKPKEKQKVVLDGFIYDPKGKIREAVSNALRDAAISRFRFIHLRLHSNDEIGRLLRRPFTPEEREREFSTVTEEREREASEVRKRIFSTALDDLKSKGYGPERPISAVHMWPTIELPDAPLWARKPVDE